MTYEDILVANGEKHKIPSRTFRFSASRQVICVISRSCNIVSTALEWFRHTTFSSKKERPIPMIPQAEQLSKESFSETRVVPADPAELSSMLNMVCERLLHPQTVMQVYADTLFLNSLTREQLVEEKVTPLAYAQRRLAVFELGILAMLRCSALASEATRYVFEKLERERATWDDRVWEICAEEGELVGERRHYPLGFIRSEEVKQTIPKC